MPLSDAQKKDSSDKMKKFTVKGIKSAKSGGGHFYFVSDPKGTEAALIVMATVKDAEGARTFREGRGILKDFKKAGKAVFCEGTVEMDGTILVFSINKGNAKPSIAKKAFKQSAMLHAAVGSTLVGALKSAKVQMAVGQEAPAESLGEDAKQERINQWKTQNAETFMSFGGDLSDEEILEMFAAEQAFSNMGDESEELERLEMEQEAAEANLRELENLQEELEDLEVEMANELEEWAGDKNDKDKYAYHDGAFEQALQAHVLNERNIVAKLQAKRIELAAKIAVSSDEYGATASSLSAADKATLDHALEYGFELITDRVLTLKNELQAETDRVNAIDWNDQSVGLVKRRAEHMKHTERKDRLENELRAIIEISESYEN